MNNDRFIKESDGDDNLCVLGLTKTFPIFANIYMSLNLNTYIYIHTSTHVLIYVIYVCNKVSTRQCL